MDSVQISPTTNVTVMISIQHDNNYIHVFISTVKPMLRGHPWDKENVVLRQVTS